MDHRQPAVMIMRPSALQRLQRTTGTKIDKIIVQIILDIILLQKHDEARVSCASEALESYVKMSNI